MAQYTIQKGDTLWDIAKANNTTVDKIQSANPSITNPNLIYAGNVINIPDAPNSNPTSSATAGSQPSQTAQPTKSTAPDYSQFEYDASGNQVYQDALVALEQMKSNKPIYAGTYEGQLLDIYNQIVNREEFSYDLNSDILYQQYKDQYVNLGQMAIKDTMGQATALTGGYGSSYGQSVGQQQYDAYLQQLNEVVPELYGMALDQYNAEGDRLMEQYALTGDLRDTEYGRYQDALDRHWQDVNYLQGQADTAYDRGFNEWYTGIQLGKADEETAYQRALDAYDKLTSLITTTGYTPTADELAKAGMTQEHVNALKSYYTQQQQAAAAKSRNSGSSGGSVAPGSTPTGTPTGTIYRDDTQTRLNPTTDELEDMLNDMIRTGKVSDSLTININTREGQTKLRNEVIKEINLWQQNGVITASEAAALKKTYAPTITQASGGRYTY